MKSHLQEAGTITGLSPGTLDASGFQCNYLNPPLLRSAASPLSQTPAGPVLLLVTGKLWAR